MLKSGVLNDNPAMPDNRNLMLYTIKKDKGNISSCLFLFIYYIPPIIRKDCNKFNVPYPHFGLG